MPVHTPIAAPSGRATRPIAVNALNALESIPTDSFRTPPPFSPLFTPLSKLKLPTDSSPILSRGRRNSEGTMFERHIPSGEASTTGNNTEKCWVYGGT